MTLPQIVEILAKNKILINFFSENVCDLSPTAKISCDSRDVEKNTLFFVKGVNFKREFLLSAIEKGAFAYVSEKDLDADIPLFLVSDVRKAMSAVARAFYGDMTDYYPLVGITGTKGKTSTLYMLESILLQSRKKVGVISTNEARCGEKIWNKTGTTPEAFELFSILDGFHKENAEAAVMEVSSQALKYDRVSGLTFSVGAFLNLSPDHISSTEHSSFNDYKEAKKKIFSLCKKAVINMDDDYSQEFLSAAENTETITFSCLGNADIYAYGISQNKNGSSFSVGGKIDIENVIINMPGKFNISNALCAVACAYALGIPEKNIIYGLEKAHAKGRLEIYEKNGITVIVDYAHNKSSFEALFEYAETFYPQSRRIMLFGCIGDRALDRRTEIPAVAAKHADFIVYTTDDPGTESPEDIFREIEPQFKASGKPYVFIEDRHAAVEFAVDLAKPGDVVILAGKGGETTQLVNGKYVPYIGDMQAAKKKLG